MDHTRVQRIGNRWYEHTVEVQVPIGTGRLHSVRVTWEIAVNRPQYCFQKEFWHWRLGQEALRSHTVQRLCGKVISRPVLLDPIENTFWAYAGAVLPGYSHTHTLSFLFSISYLWRNSIYRLTTKCHLLFLIRI